MTWAQFATPIIDIILTMPLLLRVVKNLSVFSSTKRNLLTLQFQSFSPAFLGAISCLIGDKDKGMATSYYLVSRVLNRPSLKVRRDEMTVTFRFTIIDDNLTFLYPLK